jgi:hypothetical protein
MLHYVHRGAIIAPVTASGSDKLRGFLFSACYHVPGALSKRHPETVSLVERSCRKAQPESR